MELDFLYLHTKELVLSYPYRMFAKNPRITTKLLLQLLALFGYLIVCLVCSVFLHGGNVQMK